MRSSPPHRQVRSPSTATEVGIGTIGIEWVKKYNGLAGDLTNTKPQAEGFYNTLSATRQFAWGDDLAWDQDFEQQMESRALKRRPCRRCRPRWNRCRLHPGGDVWTTQNSQGKFLAKPDSARKFRVRDLVSASSPGTPRGYEIEVPQAAGVDMHGTGDVWATVYRGDNVQQGEDVGADPLCTDAAVSAYATGPLDTINGSDVVLWVVVRHHHEPRERAEENVYLPYHYAHFSIVPRGFQIFPEPASQGRHG